MIERAFFNSGTDEHNAVGRWVSRHSFGHSDNVWPDGGSMAVVENGKPIAGVVFHDYKPASQTIQYSGAAVSRRWLAGATLHEMFSHMFDGIGCQMVTTGNAASNTGLHRILERLGHKKHVIERGWGRHMDLFLWTLTREQWAQNETFLRSRRWSEE